MRPTGKPIVRPRPQHGVSRDPSHHL